MWVLPLQARDALWVLEVLDLAPLEEEQLGEGDLYNLLELDQDSCLVVEVDTLLDDPRNREDRVVCNPKEDPHSNLLVKAEHCRKDAAEGTMVECFAVEGDPRVEIREEGEAQLRWEEAWHPSVKVFVLVPEVAFHSSPNWLETALRFAMEASKS